MQRVCFLIVPGLLVVSAQLACQSGENAAFSCLTDADCPSDCRCPDLGSETTCFINFDDLFLCGGTCDRETICPEGTSCKYDGEIIEIPGRDSEGNALEDIAVFRCTPSSGAGGNGGTGGTGGGGGGGGPLTCATACPDPPQCLEFSDDTFEEATWEHVAVRQDDGTSYGVSQGTDEQGNLDPYRFVSHRLVPPPNELIIEVAHGNTNAVYDPSDGAIRSLHYSYDGRALPDSRQASIRPLAKQGGKWFWTAFDSAKVLIDEGGWVTREWGGEADRYQGVSLVGFGHVGALDLTENGTEITFGFSSAASHKGTSETTRNTGVDNWRVVICK